MNVGHGRRAPSTCNESQHYGEELEAKGSDVEHVLEQQALSFPFFRGWCSSKTK
jgi:hypothetical protein